MSFDKLCNEKTKHTESPFQQSGRRVAIIGSGYVGASIAYAMSLRGMAREIILIDKDIRKSRGEALDIHHGIPFIGDSFVYAGTYEACKNCDLIIITAGRNRKPDETRLALITENVSIVREVVRKLQPHYNKGAVLIVSNPVDILVYCCTKWMQLPPGRVFGTGCILDTSRLIACLSNYLGISTKTISASVVGEHGNSQFPLWSRAFVGGFSLDEYCKSMGIPWTHNIREDMTNRVKNMGTTIIKAKERTHFGIATCVCSLADCIINQMVTIAPVSSVLSREYGISDVALSIPSVVSAEGVPRRLEEPWTNQEVSKLHQSADILKKIIHNEIDLHL